MRMLMIVTMLHAPFNAAVKDGSVGANMKKMLDAQKPEAAYFTELCGNRTGVLVVNLTDASQIPAFAEPRFLNFQADVQLHPTLTPADLAHAGLDKLGKQWG